MDDDSASPLPTYHAAIDPAETARLTMANQTRFSSGFMQGFRGDVDGTSDARPMSRRTLAQVLRTTMLGNLPDRSFAWPATAIASFRAISL